MKGFPAYAWLKGYNKDLLIADSIAAIIVTVMLIPQSLGYAMLAGVSPEVGLYASIIPLVAYALLGTSRTLSVGPVAVISLITAVAVSDAVAQTGADYHEAAIVLALLSGCVLVVMGFLKFGFLANFLSHPVVSGFISASGILIALSQLKHLLGISAHGDTLPSLLLSLSQGMHALNLPTLAIGSFALILLIGCRRYLVRSLIAVGLSENAAGTISKAAPVLAILLTIVATIIFDLESLGVAIVGEVPRGLPTLAFPTI